MRIENKETKTILTISLIGVLIILLIGGTAAFFTTGDSDNTIELATENLENALNYTDNTNDMKSGLIPMNTSDVDIAYTKENRCIDKNGYSACSIYQFSIENVSNVTHNLNIIMKPTINTFGNLYYIVYDLETKEKIIESTKLDNTSEFNIASNIKLNSKAKKTYEILFYVNNINENQLETDTGKTFGATIIVNSITTGQYMEESFGEQAPISKTTSYIGSYADIDKDGKVDGVIYADLAVATGEEKKWTDDDGKYTIPVTDNSTLKEYYVSQDSCTDDLCKFGDGPVLSPIGEGTERFYIMSLEDFKVDGTSTFTWYNNANTGLMTDYQTRTSGDFGKGKANSLAMIEKCANDSSDSDETYYGGCSTTDIWNYQELKDSVNNGWYIPSRGEWSAFVQELSEYLTASSKEAITTSNYSTTYGFSYSYWSSSQGSASTTYSTNFRSGYMNFSYVNINSFYVRLGATF